MPDAIYELDPNAEYDTQIRALQDSDPARASTVFNPLFQKIVNNVHAVKLAGDDLADAVEALEETAAAPGDASNIILENGETVETAIAEIGQNKASLASPDFTGAPKAPTPKTTSDDTTIATTAFVKAQNYAPLDSPMLTGLPKAPTPSAASNGTQIATTAFVKGELSPLSAAYEGADLTQRYAAEISGTAGADAEAKKWNWIKARIQAKNYVGIHIGDYIPFALTDGKQFKAEVAGIDTYYNYGDTPVGHHIDFITRDCHPDPRAWNKVDYNNGTNISPNPWLACDLYAWLNNKAMWVPNATTASQALVAVDYTTTGVLGKLPAALSAVIVEKRLLVPHRYTASDVLIDDNTWSWQNVGKLWVPFEFEVCGCNVWGSNASPNQGYSIGGFVQYPIFSCNMKRVKGAGDGGARATWWLASARGGGSTFAASVSHYGGANNNDASNTGVRAPLCFRVS